MPYIRQTERLKFDYALADLKENIKTPGELTYVVSRLLVDLFDAHPSYDSISSLIGSLECAKLEFYRRIAAPYEQAKMLANGDVYF